MADKFVQPDLEDLFGAPAARPKTEPAPAAQGFVQPNLEDLMGPSVMENWDPEQGRYVSPAEGFSTTLRPFGVDTGIPLPEWASQGLADYGAQLYGRYLGTKQRGAEALSRLPLGAGDRYRAMLPELGREAGDIRRSRRELEMTPGGLWGGLAGNLAEAMTLGRILPQTKTAAFGTGAAYGLTEPTLPGESTLANVVGGGGLGVLGKWVTDAGGKAMHGAAGAAPEWLRPYLGGLGQLPPEVEQGLALAKRVGITPRAGDLTRSPGIMRMEALAEATPFSGMPAFVKNQLNEANRYFQGVKNRLGGKFNYQETTEAVKGVLRNYEKISGESERLYDQLGKVARNTGYKTNVTTQELGPALQQLQRLDNDFWAKPFVTDDVKPLLRAVADGSRPRLTFDEWNRVKKALGGMGAIMSKQEQNGTIPGELLGAAKQAYGAALKDIQRWGRSGRNTRVKQAYDKATAFYRDEMTPFEAPENDLLRKIVFGKFDDTEYANLGTLFTEPSAQKLEQLVKYSDPTGRRALGNLMKRQTVEQTTGHSKPTGVDPISAATSFERLSPQSKQMLPDAAEQAELYARTGRMFERAGDEPASARTLLEQASHGMLQVAPWLMPAGAAAAGGIGSSEGGWDWGGAAQGGALGSLAALLAGRAGTALSTTRPGINLLTSPGTVLPGGPGTFLGAPLGMDYLQHLMGNR